jgi:hypothetical protein
MDDALETSVSLVLLQEQDAHTKRDPCDGAHYTAADPRSH